MAQTRTIDLHKDQTQTAGDVFHQGGFAITRWRDHHQQAHQIGAAVFSHSANLLGEIVPNQRQIAFGNQFIAYKRGQRLGRVFV